MIIKRAEKLLPKIKKKVADTENLNKKNSMKNSVNHAVSLLYHYQAEHLLPEHSAILENVY